MKKDVFKTFLKILYLSKKYININHILYLKNVSKEAGILSIDSKKKSSEKNC